MSNTIGRVFRVTTWGESHGPAMGAVIDGCPAGLPFDEGLLEQELKRDIPCVEVATTRRESNSYEILSGLYQGKTIGTPISIVIYNDDVESSPYRGFEGIPRPGHGDLTWRLRYGWVDPRGGGRSSGRECISRIAAGAVARTLLSFFSVELQSELIEMASQDTQSKEGMKRAIEEVRSIAAQGDSSGGLIELRVKNLPSGLGEPVFNKLEADIAAAVMGIGGVKSVEFGAGRSLASTRGSLSNDEILFTDGRLACRTNRCGGILGGISTGDPLVLKLAVKPTPTISKEQKSVEFESGESRSITCRGRHDLNFAPRVAPIAEAMVSIVLVDHCISSGLISPLSVESMVREKSES